MCFCARSVQDPSDLNWSDLICSDLKFVINLYLNLFIFGDFLVLAALKTELCCHLIRVFLCPFRKCTASRARLVWLIARGNGLHKPHAIASHSRGLQPTRLIREGLAAMHKFSELSQHIADGSANPRWQGVVRQECASRVCIKSVFQSLGRWGIRRSRGQCNLPACCRPHWNNHLLWTSNAPDTQKSFTSASFHCPIQ